MDNSSSERQTLPPGEVNAGVLSNDLAQNLTHMLPMLDIALDAEHDPLVRAQQRGTTVYNLVEMRGLLDIAIDRYAVQIEADRDALRASVNERENKATNLSTALETNEEAERQNKIEAIVANLERLDAMIFESVEDQAPMTPNKLITLLRKNGLSVSKEHQNILRNQLPNTLQSIAAKFKREGIPAELVERGERFQLFIGRTALQDVEQQPETQTDLETETKPAIDQTITPPSSPKSVKLSHEAILANRQRQIDILMGDESRIRYNMLARLYRNTFGSSKDDIADARDIIDQVMTSNNYHVENINSSKWYVRGPASPTEVSLENIPTRKVTTTTTSSKEKIRKKQEAWKELDGEILVHIFTAVAELPAQHLQQGTDINGVWNANKKLQAIAPAERARLIARRAATASEVTITNVNRTSGSGRSRRVSRMIATVTKEQWERIKDNPVAAAERVRESYEDQVEEE
jgi:hypothetical protein